jgi:ferredoxin
LACIVALTCALRWRNKSKIDAEITDLELQTVVFEMLTRCGSPAVFEDAIVTCPSGRLYST